MKIVNLLLKRFFDILLSSLAIIILVPVWVTVPIAIKIDSKGPVIFKQERRTKDGKVFYMYKFRSMIVNAEKMDLGLFNFQNDSRVTKVGKFLRNTSLDELPQVFNVFVGNMSVVGPRPCVVYELGDFDTLNNKYKKRFQVKGGITGYAQVNGRNDISWDEKVEYDNRYIDLFSRLGIAVDIKIIILSVFSVFKRKDIYEKKENELMDDETAAKLAEEEVIRMAHLPD